MNFPPLEPRQRNREYNSFNDRLRDRVVFEYLFNGMSHRQIDGNVLGADHGYSRGYLAMGILHHLGLEGVHKRDF